MQSCLLARSPVLKRTTATRIPLYTIQRLEVRLHTRTCHRAINNSIEQIQLAVETRLMAIGDQYPHLAHLCRLPVLSHLKHRQLFRYLLKHYRPFMKDIGHPMHPSRQYLMDAAIGGFEPCAQLIVHLAISGINMIP